MSERKIRALQFIEGGARYGAAVSIMSIAEGMRQCDIDVEFGIFAGRPLGDTIRERAFTLHEIPANHRFDFRGVRALTKLIRARHYDVVHTHLSRATVNGIIASLLTRTPVVSTVHGMNRKFTYMCANHIMTVSEAAKEHLVRQGVPEEKVTAVYNGIRLEPFAARKSKSDAKATYGFGPASVVLGTVSRAHQQKGIDVAIRSTAELRRRGVDAKYLFVGEGPHLEEFKMLAGEVGLSDHVQFPGYAQNVVDPLSAMDFFLFPTHREAFGISLLEAMAAEVPIIASSVDGVPEVLDQGSGILLQVRTPEAFADATQKLLDNESRRADIIRSARARVENVFSVEGTARAIEQVYRHTIKQLEPKSQGRYRNVL